MNRITQYLPLDDLLPIDGLDEAKLFAFDERDLDAKVLHNNHIRWFDPTPGQWLSEDPIGCHDGGENLTRYVD